MRRIELLSIILERFRSFRQLTTIELSPGGGLKFLSGDNRAEPRLGANGAGKSTLWDGVLYCLYGTSVRGLRAADLVSWGADQPYCKTVWLIDGQERAIERQGSPNRLLLDGNPVEQGAIDRLLGLSRAGFLHGVLFGQQVPLFIDLPMPERGALLESVLDLEIWGKASETATATHRALEKELAETATAIAFYNGKLAGLESIEELQIRADQWDHELFGKIDAAIDQVEKMENEAAEFAARVNKTQRLVNELPSIDRLQTDLTARRRSKTVLETDYQHHFRKLQEHRKEADFYLHNRICPTCSQRIDTEFSRARQRGAEARFTDEKALIRDNGQAVGMLTDWINAAEAELSTLTRKREFVLAQLTQAEADQHHHQKALEGAIRATEVIAAQINPFQIRINQVGVERAEAEAALKAAQGISRRARATIMRAEFWKAAFRRVRLFMIRRVLLQLELETAAAAEALGLIGWRIGFATEAETKSGTIRPGIHITVSSPVASAPWEAWSGGEGQRVRLAVALGLAALIQRLAGISLGFEVWDEPSAWLSPEGIEDLLDCLKHRAETSGKSLWLCDHRALIYAGFTEIWSVYKTHEGSGISLISQME